MKKFFNIKIILFAALTATLIMFAGCANEPQYSGKGTAVVKITMDMQYENIDVSSPGAQIENEGLTYTLRFGNRSHKDIIITSPGYQTLIINVTTAQLSGGSYEIESVSLSPSKVMLTINLQGISDAGGLIVTGENDDGDNIEELSANKNKITVQLKTLADTIMTISGEGIRDNVFTVSASQFINYKAAIKIPILAEDDNKVALMVYNDIPAPEYCYLRLCDYFYGDVIQETNHTVSTVFYLESGNTYKLSDQSNAKEYVIGSHTIDMLINTNPYIYVPLSMISDTKIRVPLSFSEDIENYSDIGKNNTGYNILITDLSDGRQLNFYSESDQNDDYKFFIEGLYESQQINIMVVKNWQFNPPLVHYNYTVTKQDLTQGLEIQDKQELTQLEIDFIDERGEPFVPGEELTVEIQNIYGESEFEELIQYYDDGNGFIVYIDKYVSYEISSLVVSMDGYDISSNSIYQDYLYSGKRYMTFSTDKTVRINFVDISGNEVDPSDIIENESLLREGKNYIEKNNVFNGFPIDINENYLGINYIEFNKDAFEFVDEEGGYYRATITVYRVKSVRIKFTFNRYGDRIDIINLSNNRSYYMLERNDFDEGLLIYVDEKSTASYNVNAYSNDNNYYVYDRIVITDNFDNLKGEYSFVLTVTSNKY